MNGELNGPGTSQGPSNSHTTHVFSLNLRFDRRKTRGGFSLDVDDEIDELRRVIGGGGVCVDAPLGPSKKKIGKRKSVFFFFFFFLGGL